MKLHICTYEVAGWAQSHREEIVQELAAIYNPHCNEQKYDKVWKDEWIGAYKSELTGPLAQRGPDARRSPDTDAGPAAQAPPRGS